MARSSTVMLGLVAVVAGVIGYKRYEASQLSPFRMWEIRAGAPFAKFDADAERDMHRRFACEMVEDGVRLCEAATGVPGLMRLAVDRSGRVMIVQWRFTDSTLRMTEEARRMAAEWTVVDRQHSRSGGPGGRGRTRWVTADSAWSASMTDLTDPHRARSIDLVDERRLRRVADSSPAAVLQLAQTGYLDREAMSAEFARAPAAFAAAAVRLGAAGRARAAAATALPRCVRESSDSVVAGTAMRESYGSDQAELLEQVIPAAFPGKRLVLARRSYLEDADGAVEEIRILPPSGEGDAFAVAVSFPRRVEAVNSLVAGFVGGAAQCRASAVIIVGHRDPLTGQLGAVQVIDADEESLASAIGALDPVPTASGSPAFAIHYTATYGTRSWIGEVDWDAIIELDQGTPHVSRRHPTVVGRKDADDHETAGIAVVEKESAAGMQLAIVRATDDSPTPLFLAAGPHGLPSGWVLLDLLK